MIDKKLPILLLILMISGCRTDGKPDRVRENFYRLFFHPDGTFKNTSTASAGYQVPDGQLASYLASGFIIKNE